MSKHLYFTGEHCPACKVVKPIVEKHLDKITIMDITDHMDLAKQYNIMSIPTLLIFKNDKIDSSITGTSIASWINKHL